MNKLIKKQLEKCKVAAIPTYDDNTIHIIIPKTAASNEASFIPNKYYLIEINNAVLYDNVLAANWNNNLFPPENQMNVCVIQLLGKMVKLDCVGANNNKAWAGWLPIKEIKIIKELT